MNHDSIEEIYINIYIHILSATSGSSGTFFFVCLFKSYFLLLPHIPPGIFLFSCSFNFQCLRRDESLP